MNNFPFEINMFENFYEYKSLKSYLETCDEWKIQTQIKIKDEYMDYPSDVDYFEYTFDKTIWLIAKPDGSFRGCFEKIDKERYEL